MYLWKLDQSIINDISAFGVFVFPHIFANMENGVSHYDTFYSMMTLPQKLTFNQTFRAFAFFTFHNEIFSCIVKRIQLQDFGCEEKILRLLIQKDFRIIDMTEISDLNFVCDARNCKCGKYFKVWFTERSALRYVDTPKIDRRLKIRALDGVTVA